jgi:hypothetical protein
MRRPAVLRFGLLAGIATFACWSGPSAPRTTPIENRRPIQQTDVSEAWWCSISHGDYEYPQMPCEIRTVAGERMLVKLAGSQRFRGVITPRGRGFRFEGELYCPWGDCSKQLVGEFQPVADGSLRGTFADDGMIVTLVRAPANTAWGGASYGGATYGGSGYGGFGYGGARRRRP